MSLVADSVNKACCRNLLIVGAVIPKQAVVSTILCRKTPSHCTALLVLFLFMLSSTTSLFLGCRTLWPRKSCLPFSAIATTLRLKAAVYWTRVPVVAPSADAKVDAMLKVKTWLCYCLCCGPGISRLFFLHIISDQQMTTIGYFKNLPKVFVMLQILHSNCKRRTGYKVPENIEKNVL